MVVGTSGIAKIEIFGAGSISWDITREKSNEKKTFSVKKTRALERELDAEGETVRADVGLPVGEVRGEVGGVHGREGVDHGVGSALVLRHGVGGQVRVGERGEGGEGMERGVEVRGEV